MTAFLISGVCAQAGPATIGEDYIDADDRHYLPLLVHPVLVFDADPMTTAGHGLGPLCRNARCRFH